MRVGISELFTGSDGRDGKWMLDAAQLIEELGFNSLWVPERMTFLPEYRSTHPYGAQRELKRSAGCSSRSRRSRRSPRRQGD